MMTAGQLKALAFVIALPFGLGLAWLAVEIGRIEGVR